ncbi:retrovirus-related Pol polyprotein from transposon 297 [Trichonephila clavipes]|nr:retrovirus-related Pol polyprotein from transposon 297 [Trichonephila clavipes]
MTGGRTKCTALVNQVLFPYSMELVQEDLKNDVPFSVATDASNTAEFSCSAKKREDLKECFDFFESEYREVIRHVPTRWLSLFNALDRMLSSWGPLKSNIYEIIKKIEKLSGFFLDHIWQPYSYCVAAAAVLEINVRLWIAQCDHAFTFSGISSDDTKYSALVANLDAETLSYVSDIVLSPPNSDKYHTLSQRLITQFSDSETQKIKKLLTDLQLGDEKPSHLLRKMKELSNGQLQDDFLQSLWFQRMPPHIQTVLSASSEPLDKLAIIADKVSEVVGSSSTICAATTVPPPSQSSSCSVQPTMDSLARQIQELSLQVAELTRERNSSRHQRYSSDRRRSHSRSRSVNRGSGICYYHRRYKEQARKCVSPCAFVQKKRVSSVIAGMAEPSKHTSRLFLLDRKSGQKFLIDSGSEICVIPPSPTMNKSPQSNFSLFVANNTKIPAYGMVRKELNLGLRRPFIWTFIIADVSSPIIGADFLKHFNLLIDLKKKRLVDVETSLFISCVFSNIVQRSILTVDANISFKNILSEYPDLSNPSLISKSASHGTVHHIITTGPPVTARPRRLYPKLYDAVKVEFEFLLAQGIIRPSKSPWSSPLHVVPKSDSTVRPVGDYRQLNSVTEFDS